jgi:hypothetical protein
MRQTLFVLLCCALLLTPGPLLARSIMIETHETTTPNGKQAFALVLNGKVVAQLAKPSSNGGKERTPQRAIAAAAALLTEAYRAGKVSLSVQQSEAEGKRYALFLNGRLLLLATDPEGKAWGATPEQLAQTWRRNITEALDMGDPGTPLPAAEPYKPAPALPKPGPAFDVPAPTGGTIDTGAGSIKPKGYDTAGLHVSPVHNVYEPPLNTRVSSPLKPPPQLTALVTGAAANPEVVTAAIEGVLRAYGRVSPTVPLSWKPIEPEKPDLRVGPGQKLRLKVNFNASDAPLDAEVVVENRQMSTPRENTTFFSNVPENVKKQQLLYYADLPAGESARLVYHHQNQAGGNLTFVARVVNTTGTPTSVHVIPGKAKPDINTFFVGFKSAESFWTNLNAGAGYVLTVPAGGQAYLVSQVMKPGFTSSGYYKLTNLGDTGLRVETLSLGPGVGAPKGPWPDATGASCGVYPEPYDTVKASYTVGGPDTEWLVLRLGDDAPKSLTDGTLFHGCYGMTHSYEVELRNPGSSPALAFLLLRGSAGEVKGQFYIDNEYVATSLISGGEEQLLREIPLKPGQTRLLRVKAIALNGGFYPASLVVREKRLP